LRGRWWRRVCIDLLGKLVGVSKEKTIYVLCFVFDCRGNPLENAKVTFHSVIDDERQLLGIVPTSGIRSRPAGVLIKHPPAAHQVVEVQVSFKSLESEVLHLDASENRFCEFIFHVDDEWHGNATRKRRTRWRCRCENRTPEARSIR
jgi:hypothetical protein